MVHPFPYQSSNRSALARTTKAASRLPAVLLFLACGGLCAQTPHLVVVLTAEQFRADYFERYHASFSRAGFHRLISEGASYKRSRFGHASNFAAPNAAILSTGAYPRTHGIVGDRWYDAAGHELVSAEGAAQSPAYLVGSTVADELHLASNGESKVVAISGRAAPAVLTAGRRPTGCYWLNASGAYVSSPFYTADLPGWVVEFNERSAPGRYHGSAWMAVDAAPNAKPLRILPGLSDKFAETFLSYFRASPFAAARTFELAKIAIQRERLGLGDHPDLLYVNFTAPALLALETGSGSPLMRDMVLRLDSEIAGFLNWLDEEIGLDRTAIVFTGLHGIPPTPEAAAKAGLPSGRIHGEKIVAAINQALQAEFGPGPTVEKYVFPAVTFNGRFHKLGEERRLRAIHLAGRAATALRGVAAYYTAAGESGYDSAAFRRSLHPGRSGDLILSYEPFFVEHFGEPRGTGTGSMYRYDSDVPLVLYGPRFRSLRSMREVDAASVAPTLATLLGIAAPSSARYPVLREAFKSSPAPAPAVGPALPPEIDDGEPRAVEAESLSEDPR